MKGLKQFNVIFMCQTKIQCMKIERGMVLRTFIIIHTFTITVLTLVLLGGSGGLLTPLSFARHHLSPLAAFSFTSGAYFLHNESMEGGDSEFANFILPTLKAFLEAHSQNVSGNKQ